MPYKDAEGRGFVYGLFYASTLIESKICRKVLVCCGDLALRDLDCFVSQKSNNFVFADGAGVADHSVGCGIAEGDSPASRQTQAAGKRA